MLVASACTISPRRLLSSIHKMAYHGEEHACRFHGGHNKLTLQYDEALFEKLKFDAWETERFSHSLQDKVAAVEGHGTTRRP